MNNDLFKSNPGNIKDADTTNEAGGRAYAMTDREALCQYVLTGTLHNTFYTRAEDQLKQIVELCDKINDLEFVGKLAVYARENGRMKDTPALLCAYIASKDTNLLKRVFPRAIDNVKMLRNFCKVVRSGVLGRKSFGTAPKTLIQNYLNALTDEQLFRSNIGNDPSLADVIKMVHPKAPNDERNALYGYLLDKKYNAEKLLPTARAFEAFKADMSLDVPSVPFLMLTALPLTDEHYKTMAVRCSFDQLRQNLNNFARHNVFKDKAVVAKIAAKLADPEEVRRARLLPYQLFTTFYNVDDDVPNEIKLAIQAAGEVALENTPSFEGEMDICLDVSGSMSSPATGYRGSATSKMSFVQVGAMLAAAVLRKNKLARVVPFDTKVHDVKINPLDSVATNAQKLSIRGGGTNCDCALRYLNENGSKAKTVLFISDNESWRQSGLVYKQETAMMREWQRFKERNPQSRLINLDIAPYATSQTYGRSDILMIGGFSDSVFDVIADFVTGKESTMVKTVEAVQLG